MEICSLPITVCFFEVRFFWQLWLVGCTGCTVFGCLWQTSLCWIFGQQFFLAGQGM